MSISLQNQTDQTRRPFIYNPGQGSPEFSSHIFRHGYQLCSEPFLNQVMDRTAKDIALPQLLRVLTPQVGYQVTGLLSSPTMGLISVSTSTRTI